MEVATAGCVQEGDHLAKVAETGGLLLRVSTQCPKVDKDAFKDVMKYKSFNTINLWVDLVALKAIFARSEGTILLGGIPRPWTLATRSPPQSCSWRHRLGAAISCFEVDRAACLIGNLVCR